MYSSRLQEVANGDVESRDRFQWYNTCSCPLRGKLDSIELRCNRGIGLQAEKIDTVTASVFGTISNAAEHPDSFPLLQEATTAMLDLSREHIVKVSVSYQSEMDYYHPRIAT